MFLLLLTPKNLALGEVAIYSICWQPWKRPARKTNTGSFLPVLVRVKETLYILQQSHIHPTAHKCITASYNDFYAIKISMKTV